jgi:hypothetical protein
MLIAGLDSFEGELNLCLSLLGELKVYLFTSCILGIIGSSFFWLLKMLNLNFVY